MKILLNNNDLNEALKGVSNLGFVPTMGSLHKGHISLIKKSLRESNKTIVSIFINPTQFNNTIDFKNYPRNYKKDLSILKKMKVDFLYVPKKKDIFSSKRKFRIKLNKIDKILCAKYRKGHYEGVLDIMDRLTNTIKPKNIFMGIKDFQQLHLVKRFIHNNYNSKVIACKTIREKNKLALSSRNFLLDKTEFKKAGNIAKTIILLKKELNDIKNTRQFLTHKKKELNKRFNINIEYLELRKSANLKKTNKIKKARIFIAYYLGKVRLIDNF